MHDESDYVLPLHVFMCLSVYERAWLFQAHENMDTRDRNWYSLLTTREFIGKENFHFQPELVVVR